MNRIWLADCWNSNYRFVKFYEVKKGSGLAVSCDLTRKKAEVELKNSIYLRFEDDELKNALN